MAGERRANQHLVRRSLPLLERFDLRLVQFQQFQPPARGLDQAPGRLPLGGRTAGQPLVILPGQQILRLRLEQLGTVHAEHRLALADRLAGGIHVESAHPPAKPRRDFGPARFVMFDGAGGAQGSPEGTLFHHRSGQANELPLVRRHHDGSPAGHFRARVTAGRSVAGGLAPLFDRHQAHPADGAIAQAVTHVGGMHRTMVFRARPRGTRPRSAPRTAPCRQPHQQARQ